MSGDRDLRARTAAEMLALTGGDPFQAVLDESERHRVAHGEGCGLHPAGPVVMRLAATIARATAAKTILDLGSGLGYSSLWLAALAGDGAHVVGIDRFTEHVDDAIRFAADHGLGDRCSFIAGDVADVLPTMDEPVDLIHDDAWFAAAPAHIETAISLLRLGGTMTMPNWFLLEDAVTGSARMDWSQFAGPTWASDVHAYAERLAADTRLVVTWSISPPLGIGVRIA